MSVSFPCSHYCPYLSGRLHVYQYVCHLSVSPCLCLYHFPVPIAALISLDVFMSINMSVICLSLRVYVCIISLFPLLPLSLWTSSCLSICLSSVCLSVSISVSFPCSHCCPYLSGRLHVYQYVCHLSVSPCLFLYHVPVPIAALVSLDVFMSINMSVNCLSLRVYVCIISLFPLLPLSLWTSSCLSICLSFVCLSVSMSVSFPCSHCCPCLSGRLHVYQYVCLSVSMSVSFPCSHCCPCLSGRLHVYQYVCHLSVSPCLCLYHFPVPIAALISLDVFMSINMSVICLSLRVYFCIMSLFPLLPLSLWTSSCLSICLSFVCLSVSMSVSFPCSHCCPYLSGRLHVYQYVCHLSVSPCLFLYHVPVPIAALVSLDVFMSINMSVICLSLRVYFCIMSLFPLLPLSLWTSSCLSICLSFVCLSVSISVSCPCSHCCPCLSGRLHVYQYVCHLSVSPCLFLYHVPCSHCCPCLSGRLHVYQYVCHLSVSPCLFLYHVPVPIAALVSLDVFMSINMSVICLSLRVYFCIMSLFPLLPLSLWTSSCLSVCLSFVCLSVSMSVSCPCSHCCPCLSGRPSCLSICLSFVCLSVSMSVSFPCSHCCPCLSGRLHVYQYVCHLSVSPCLCLYHVPVPIAALVSLDVFMSINMSVILSLTLL